MRGSIVALSATLSVAACGPAGQDGSTNNVARAAASTVPAKAKRPAYCFFKDEETKGWIVSAAASGDVTVKGKAHVKDARYRADLGAGEVAGSTARISPTLAPNTTGYASPDNWWDVSATVPGSSAVETVTVECGKKRLAELKVKRN